MLNKNPEEITLGLLEVVIMPNGELINQGKAVGWFKDNKKYLSLKQEGRFIPKFDRQGKSEAHNCMEHIFCEVCGLDCKD